MIADPTLIRQFARAADDGAMVTIGESVTGQDLDIAALDREIAARDREIAACAWPIAAECRRGSAALRANAAHALSPAAL